MRTIKFRGIELESRNWVYGSLLSFDPIPEIQETEFDEDAYDYQRWEVEPESVGQFTGLTDKNGKEIYEGDILLCRKAIEPEDKGFVCVFENSAFRFKNVRHTNDDYYDIKLDEYDYVNEQLEIIGNIHENPELL